MSWERASYGLTGHPRRLRRPRAASPSTGLTARRRWPVGRIAPGPGRLREPLRLLERTAPGTSGCMRGVGPRRRQLGGPANGFPEPCRMGYDRRCRQAPIAQSAERLHGKEKVYGSIPYWGSATKAPAPSVGGGLRHVRPETPPFALRRSLLGRPLLRVAASRPLTPPEGRGRAGRGSPCRRTGARRRTVPPPVAPGRPPRRRSGRCSGRGPRSARRPRACGCPRGVR